MSQSCSGRNLSQKLTLTLVQPNLFTEGVFMRVGYVEIQNFRGISSLEWAPEAGLNCLIGPSNSCKTTILDAVELALSPRHTLTFDDLDFYNGDPDKPALITVTLIDLPAEFTSDGTGYAHYLRGFAKDKKVTDEPPVEENGVPALSIRLTIDASLEGKWILYNDRVASGSEPERSLSYKHRLRVAPARLGVYADRHLSWGRNSILTRMTERVGGTKDILAKAGRLARSHFKAEAGDLFKTSLEDVTKIARLVGMALPPKLSVGLDTENLSITNGSISIHDGEIPLRVLGTGSSRLLVAALQDAANETASLTIIDEVEYGLEPHRIVRLLKHLKSADRKSPQVFVTSHSPTVIRELKVDDLAVVRRTADGKVIVCPASKKFASLNPQAPPRSMPEAYLAPSLLICEGKTEVGLIKGLDDFWFNDGRDSMAVKGIALVDGGGIDHAPALAGHFYSLSYDVAVLIDSDRDPDDATIIKKLRDKGVSVFRWDPPYATEDLIFQGLPAAGLEALLDYTLTLRSEGSVLHAANVGRAPEQKLTTIDELRQKLAEPEIRSALAERAKGKIDSKTGKRTDAWYKDIDRADYIGHHIVGPNLKNGDAALKTALSNLRTWIDGRP